MANLFGENWIYENNADNSARFVLGEAGENPLICVGVNPSTAEPDKLDPTLRNVKGWAKRLGYDGWMMLNLYPQRATNPKDLHDKTQVEYIDRFAKATGHKVQNLEPSSDIIDSNISCWGRLFEKYYWVTVWAAWGTLIEKRPYLKDCLAQLGKIVDDHNCAWIHIGKLSQGGHPHHPLYLSKSSEVQEFNIKEYLNKFSS